jgi:GH25 family lysozyme M1 (1,4-beta-N-acetylmuramidase)
LVGVKVHIPKDVDMPLARNRRRRTAAVIVAISAGVAAFSAAPADAEPAHQPSLSTAARGAGLEPGNAYMGWRESSPSLVDSRAPAQAGLASVRLASAFTPAGVLGMDVSSYQRTVNWPAWAAQGRQFAYVKATEGTSYRNPYFSSQFSGANRAGMIRGAYHFASPSGSSGKAQAAYFVRNGGAWTRNGRTLPGVLDIEYNPYGSTCYHQTKPQMVRWISSFVTEYKRQTTRDAVIYTTADWWRRCTGNTTKFALTNPLWVARYSTAAGALPGGWSYFTFWQYTSDPLDQNTFSASHRRLVVLANGG